MFSALNQTGPAAVRRTLVRVHAHVKHIIRIQRIADIQHRIPVGGGEAVISAVVSLHDGGVNNICLSAVFLIFAEPYLGFREGIKVSGSADINPQSVVIGSVLGLIPGGPIYQIVTGSLIIDSFRRPYTAGIFKSGVYQFRLAPVHQVVGLPDHNVLAGVLLIPAAAACSAAFRVKVGAQDPVAVSLRGADDVGISDSQVAALGVIHQHRLGIAVGVFVQLAPGKTVFTVAEENLLIAAGGVKVGPQIACRIVRIQIFRHRLYRYLKGFLCRLSLQADFRSQSNLHCFFSCRRAGYLAAVVQTVFVHGLVCNNIGITRRPVDRCSVLALFHKSQVASHIVRVLNGQSVRRFLKQ